METWPRLLLVPLTLSIIANMVESVDGEDSPEHGLERLRN